MNLKNTAVAIGLIGGFSTVIKLGEDYLEKRDKEIDYQVTERITNDTSMRRTAISNKPPHQDAHSITFVNKMTGERERFDARYTEIKAIPEL